MSRQKKATKLRRHAGKISITALQDGFHIGFVSFECCGEIERKKINHPYLLVAVTTS